MTEEEAKLKRCCGPEDCGQLGNDNHVDRYCIGSACMAWRATDNEAGPSAPDGAPPTYKAAGYCGLAGKP